MDIISDCAACLYSQSCAHREERKVEINAIKNYILSTGFFREPDTRIKIACVFHMKEERCKFDLDELLEAFSE